MPSHPRLDLVLLGIWCVAYCSACQTQAGPAPEPRVPSADPADGPRGHSRAAPTYSVHEWGLVALPMDGSQDVALRTLPPAAPPPVIDARPAAPLLFFHLGEGVDELRLDAQVDIVGGRVTEHWPPSSVRTEPGTVRWEGVVASAGSCSGAPHYPGPQSPHCRQLPDQHCEATALAAYEARGGTACLTFGQGRYNHLFYRGVGRRPASALNVSRRGTSVLVERAVGSESVGRLIRVSKEGSLVRLVLADVPPVGQSVTLPAPTESDFFVAERDLNESMAAIGLTSEEAASFMAAWRAAIFSPNAGLAGAPGGAPPADALYYWLDEAAVTSIARLHFEPAPAATHRAFLARVDLGSAD